MSKFKQIFEQTLKSNKTKSILNEELTIYEEDIPKLDKLLNDIYVKNKNKDFIFVKEVEILNNYNLYFFKEYAFGKNVWYWNLLRGVYKTKDEFKNMKFSMERDYYTGGSTTVKQIKDLKLVINDFKKYILKNAEIL